MKSDVLRMIDKEYVSKSNLRDELISLRKSIFQDIQVEKRRTVGELRLLFLGFCSCLAIAAWLYVNILMG